MTGLFFFATLARMQHWLFKSEPDVYGIDRLAKEKRTEWSGVRNYQARNFMMTMAVGDLGFFYHSSTKIPGIAGVCKVIKAAYPDFTALDPKSEYHDPKATPDKPIWQMVDVGYVRKFKELLPLDDLRAVKPLAGMRLLARGTRLSVQPVTAKEWATIIAIADSRG